MDLLSVLERLGVAGILAGVLLYLLIKEKGERRADQDRFLERLGEINDKRVDEHYEFARLHERTLDIAAQIVTGVTDLVKETASAAPQLAHAAKELADLAGVLHRNRDGGRDHQDGEGHSHTTNEEQGSGAPSQD